MAIAVTRYDTATLLAVMREVEPVQNFWLGYFPNQINFDTEYVDFSQINESRQIAPLVVPTAQGKPIYATAEKAMRVKPAYVKPKDPVSASRVIKRVAGFGELATGANPMSPAQRYNAIVGDILAFHRKAIERRWEWMASEAIQHGLVTLESEDYPRTVVDFQRAAGHTIVKGAGTRWGDAGVSILGDVEAWRNLTRTARFGGIANRLICGTEAWAKMQADSAIRELLGLDLRPSNNGLALNLGLREGLEVEYVGKLNGVVEVWVYSDYYEDAAGAVVPFMSPKDVILTGPSINGYRCFGAIQDVEATFQPLEIFPKMWNEKDPSVTFIMSQSAPLMVPVNTNATLRARVVA